MRMISVGLLTERCHWKLSSDNVVFGGRDGFRRPTTKGRWLVVEQIPDLDPRFQSPPKSFGDFTESTRLVR